MIPESCYGGNEGGSESVKYKEDLLPLFQAGVLMSSLIC